MDNPFESPVILSTCPGILGLERGLKRAIGDFTVAAYVEIEAFIIENLVAAMEAGILAPAPIWTDIKTFPAEVFRNRIDGIIGGYPCQPFSNAGDRKGEDDPRHLWPYFKSIIVTTKPFFCFFENVSGHLSLGFDTVYRSLSDMGYRVEAGIYTAEEVGAPHERERLFILALWNTSSNNQWRDWIYNSGSQIETRRSSVELGNPNFKFIQKRKIKSGLRDESGGTNKMGNTGYGLQRIKSIRSREWEQLHQEDFGATQGNRSSNPSESKWPAKPGEKQYPWEEKRAVKSGLGITINGYNFREDLLRAAGNSVVEQTAELAFKDLLRKHFKN